MRKEYKKNNHIKADIDLPSPSTSMPSLRPSSVQSAHDTPKTTQDIRPKSGKSLTSHLSDGYNNTSPAASPMEFRYGYRCTVRTPLSATRIHASLTDGRASVRDGARSPTPNAAKDMMEPAFLKLDLYAFGITVWRIQGSNLLLVDVNEYGFFHEGNAYIIFNVIGPNYRSLHYWIGCLCSEKDAKLVEQKSHDLDRIVRNAHVFSREIQGYESVCFLSNFPDGVVYIEGKHKVSVSRAAVYDKRMYLVSGRKYLRASCMLPTRDLLQCRHIIILDGFPRIYIWIGQESNLVLRTKTVRLARKMQQRQCTGASHIVVIDENDTNLSEAFKRKFDDNCTTTSFTTEPDNQVHDNQVNGDVANDHIRLKDEKRSIHTVIHRVSGDKVLYDMPEAFKRPFKHCYLVSRDSYLLDRGPDKALYIWVGSNAMENEINNAVSRVKSFAIHNGYQLKSPLIRVKEEYEPVEFKKCFCDWRDKLSKDMSLCKRYSAGNIGRALFSRTNQRTIATVRECWSEDIIGDCNDSVLHEYEETTQAWILNNEHLENWEHLGLFTKQKCFLILHRTLEVLHHQIVIYVWMGSKASPADMERIVHLALAKNKELENRAVLVRVLDGKEPQHFLTALQDWIMIYDGDENSKEDVQVKLFCVRDCCKRGIRIHQMVPSWSSLCSSASFVILAQPNPFLWFGKQSGSTEREAAKELLNILCSSKMFSYEIVTECKEPPMFDTLFGERKPERPTYHPDYKEKVLERRTACLVHYGQFHRYEDIDDFMQEDLSEEDIAILDTFDQVFVWCGDRVQEDKKTQLYDVAKEYIQQDPAGRELESVVIWIVSQGTEPLAFTKHFRSWNALGYLGRHSYDVLRKQVRQENAKKDINQSLVESEKMGGMIARLSSCQLFVGLEKGSYSQGYCLTFRK